MTKRNYQLGALGLTMTVSLLAWFCTYSEQPLIHSRSLQTYLTTTTRNPEVDTACSGYTRSQFSVSQQNGLSSYVGQLNTTLGIDGNAIIKYLRNYDTTKANDQASKSVGFIIFLVTFVLGLILFVIVVPFLCCCCCCTNCCPCNCCCRKDDSQPFKEKDIQCPLCSLVVLLICVIIVAIYGLIATTSTRQSFSKVSCTGAILTDDLMNGNVTNDGSSFFMGLNIIPSILEQIRTNLTNIDNNLTQIYSTSPTTTVNQAISQVQTAKTDTILISNNDAVGNPLTLNYNTPLDTTVTTAQIPSDFPPILGSFSTRTGLVNTLYTSLDLFEVMLTGTQNSAKNLNNNLASFDSNLAAASANATNLRNSVSNSLGVVNNQIVKSNQGTRGYAAGIVGYFAGIIVLALICGIAALCAYSKKSECCRKFMYFFCFIIFLGCIFSFILAIFYSFTLPFYTWSCIYYDDALSSQANFQNNLNLIFDITTLQKLGVCLPSGNGDIYTQIAGNSASTQFNTLNTIFNDLNNFTISGYITPIFTALTNTLTETDNYGLGKLMDIKDSPSLAVLSSLSTPATGALLCNSNLLADSWVPSNSQSSFSSFIINCPITNGNVGNSGTCSSGVSTTVTCQGCMDSSQVLFRYLNTANSLPTDLALRYGAICTFNTKLNNVWTNYYNIKLSAIGPTVGGTSSSSGVYPRTKTVQTDVNTLNSTVDPALPSLFANINTNMASISALTDPTFGLFGGANCKLLGESAIRFRNAACDEPVTHMYLVRIASGTISYLLLVVLCCAVCFGSRHARMMQQESRYGFTTTGQQNPCLQQSPAGSNENFKSYI